MCLEREEKCIKDVTAALIRDKRGASIVESECGLWRPRWLEQSGALELYFRNSTPFAKGALH